MVSQSGFRRAMLCQDCFEASYLPKAPTSLPYSLYYFQYQPKHEDIPM